MTEFNPEKFREAIYTAKVYAYAAGSRDPFKEALLKRLRTLMDEAQELCDQILEGEVRRT